MNYPNPRQKHPPLLARNWAYRQTLGRLDEALEKSTPSDNSKIIAAMRLAYFADVDELEKSGRIEIPKK
jgi:hypothetical protein